MRQPTPEEIKEEIIKRYMKAISDRTCVKVVVMWAVREKKISERLFFSIVKEWKKKSRN